MQINYLLLTSVFGISEASLLLTRRSKNQAVKTRSDKNSLSILWVSMIGSLTLGGALSGYGRYISPYHDLFFYVGLALVAMGFLIRWASIIQLGKFFTVDVAITSSHFLKTDGLYKVVRHPSYLGLMLIISGIALFQDKLLPLIVIVIPVFLALNYRIKVEEKVLTEAFGDQYIAYKRKAARLIPGLY